MLSGVKMKRTLYFMILLVIACRVGYAQGGYFDDLYLDGDGTNPFIQFKHVAHDSHYIFGLREGIGFWISGGFKFRVNETAEPNAMIIDSNGTNVRRALNVATSTDVENQISITHEATEQTFGLASLASSELASGGIGLNTDTNSFPFFVFDNAKERTMSIGENGVALGLEHAHVPLHVYADGGTFSEAKILVENNLSSDPAVREMISLVNNGGSRFAFTDTSLLSTWVLGTNGNGQFCVSQEGTGESEWKIHPGGRITMGPGGAKNFDLRSNGNLYIKGTLVQSSDKNLKTAFASVDEVNILQRISEMPVQTWQFRFDDPSLRHMGPTAQDFYAAFGLGINDKTIAPVDGIGVSLAAIKALKKRADENAAIIIAYAAKAETQRNELARQKELIQSQEELLKRQQKLLESLSKRIGKLESRQSSKPNRSVILDSSDLVSIRLGSAGT